MKYADIILHLKENYEEDLKRVLRDALISLKTNGVQQIKTQQIVTDFSNRGINISTPELLNLLQNDPLIQDANQDVVTFTQDNPDVSASSVDQAAAKAEQDANTIDSMADKALNKRI
jgi:hypothetical protein